MRNAKGQNIPVPTTEIVEAIRRAQITQAVSVKDNATGHHAGAALFSGNDLKLILDPSEVEAVSDLLTLAEMEALFNDKQKDA